MKSEGGAPYVAYSVRTMFGTVFGPCVAQRTVRRTDLGFILCSYGATYRKDDGHGAIPAVDPAEVFGAGADLKPRLTSLFIPLSASGYRRGRSVRRVRCFTVPYVVVRCFTVSYVAVRCRSVFCSFAGPCVVRCSYEVETVCDVQCAPFWMK